MENIRNSMAARASDLKLYLDYNPDHAKFNEVSVVLGKTMMSQQISDFPSSLSCMLRAKSPPL